MLRNKKTLPLSLVVDCVCVGENLILDVSQQVYV